MTVPTIATNNSVSAGVPPSAPDDLARLQKLRAAFDSMRREIGQVVIGQDAVVEELLMAVFARGSLHSCGGSRPGENPPGQHGLARFEFIVQAYPVYARPDACRHHGHGNHTGRPDDAGAQIRVFARAPLCQYDSGG